MFKIDLFSFDKPIGRKEYFKGIVKRIFISLIIILIYLFIDLWIINPNNTLENTNLFTSSNYPLSRLSLLLFFSLDYRRIKDIGVDLKYLGFYYAISLIPDLSQVSTGSWVIIYFLINVYNLAFVFFLFFKKGSLYKSRLKKDNNPIT